MKTTKHHEDGIEWLRSLRGKIADECGHDLAKQSALYRQAAAKSSYKVYRSVDRETDDSISAETLAEMERRDADHEANPSSGCSLEELESELFKRK